MTVRPLLGLCLVLTAVLTTFGGVPSAAAFCGCRQVKPAACESDALFRLTTRIDLAVVDGTVELLTQTGPFHMPAEQLDGKTVFMLVLPKGEILQGFFEEIIPGTLRLGTMTGTQAEIATDAVFPPGEYELVLFVDSETGGGASVGPQRGDIAAFDNTVCEPTGVSVRFAVGCEDATVTVTNKHFILF